MNATTLTRLREPKLHVGTWLSIGSPVIAELAAECNFTKLAIDSDFGILRAGFQRILETGRATLSSSQDRS